MERIEAINRKRLLWCCAERGVSAQELARDVGIAEGTIQKVLEGDAGLTFNQLRKVAEYFGRGVLFFLDPAPLDTERIHTVQYRTLAGLKPNLSFQIKRIIERVEHQRDLFLSLREDLRPEDYVQFAAPDVSGVDLDRAAIQVRNWLKLEDQNTFDAYREAVQAKGILVFRTNGYAGEWQIPKNSPVLGFAIYDERCPVIVVRKARWETQQTFTLMHELAHLILHRESSIDDAGDMNSRTGMEREANAFAAKVLVPSQVLSQIRDADRPADVAHAELWLTPQRRRLGVSTEVLLRCLLDAGRITQDFYLAYRAHVADLPEPEEAGGSRAYRHREPKHLFGEVYVRTVLDALHGRRISAVKASQYLDGIKISDLHQLERHIAGI